MVGRLVDLRWVIASCSGLVSLMVSLYLAGGLAQERPRRKGKAMVEQSVLSLLAQAIPSGALVLVNLTKTV